MDVTTLSDEDLAMYMNAMAAEQQRRGAEQRLKDKAWSLVMDAKNAGYSKAQVAQHLTSVVTQAFGDMGV